MSNYVFYKGKFKGKFEELYKNIKCPFNQVEQEKFETSKKAIINYCEMISYNKKKKLKTLEIGCGFGNLSNNLRKLGFKTYGTDISETAIKKAKKKNNKCNFYQSDFINEDLYLKINPDIIIMSEVSWYVLPKLKKFIKFIKKNFKNKYLIHTLAIYHPKKQKYGINYFTDLKGILKFFNLNYIEYGEKWNTKEGRTFFLAKL